MGVIVVLLALMMATIIGATVLFAFADAGQTVQRKTEFFDIPAHDAKTYCILSNTPDETTSNIIVDRYNSTAVDYDLYVITTHYTVVDNNVTVKDTAYGPQDLENGSVIRVRYNAIGYTSVANVGTYAIIVFTMLAIVPLVIVGGVMLRSLGFFSGGSGKP